MIRPEAARESPNGAFPAVSGLREPARGIPGYELTDRVASRRTASRSDAKPSKVAYHPGSYAALAHWEQSPTGRASWSRWSFIRPILRQVVP